MDTGRGEFAPVSHTVAEMFGNIPDLRNSRIFTVGEIVKVKGSKFKVEKIKQRTLRLLLLPDEEYERR